MRRGKVKREKAPAGLTMEKITPERRCWRSWWCADDDYLEDGDVGVFRIDLWRAWRSLAVVDTTYSQGDDVTTSWLKEVSSLLRGRRLRAPLVVGLVALRGRPPKDWRWSWSSRGARGNPQSPDNPIRCLALCVGGSHALVYQPDCCSYNYTGGPLPFREDNKMRLLREFLTDKRVFVACLGAAEVAKKLAEEWGLHVASPAELTDLFARAYGKEIRVEPEVLPGKPVMPEKNYYWMSREMADTARAKVQAHYDTELQEYEEKSKQGRWIPKAIKGLSMEYMARVALGPDMRLAPLPAKLADADWGGRDLPDADDKWMYATRDAYLCFDIAAHCLPRIGLPVA
ncbi:uncharacterized protein LOC100831232 [Brachypodium distachyon]|uniref:3'-5' exonuclease domain-containing protein n=1 Tax=Brachypodium distachyon TaxID=15368 RepID=I1HNP7_BRADI|nr:uncharacterized protein LOC100831232 [Brachypodium distachyon]KQK08357.1 hypothetical protein BRADI_2g41380v3 [Brachypodium distachyon]|eukprot:XP_003566788.1 uncharacterized protein LOC100831232 [Brachypodium distachyon]